MNSKTEERALDIPSPLALMPAMDVAQAIARRQAVVKLVKTSGFWVDGVDCGAIPGTDKPTLLKPGAEKLCSFFGLANRLILTKSIEDWTGRDHGEMLFFYKYTCELWHGDLFVAEGAGSCSSWESKYRYRWVDESEVPEGLSKDALKKRGGQVTEFDFAIKAGETSGKYGKPSEYWQRFRDAIADGTAVQCQKETRSGAKYLAWAVDTTVYRIPNDDAASLVNTVDKMAQKRAFIAATLIAANASEFFTQDLEDFIDGDIIEGSARAVPTPPPNGNGDHPEPARQPEPQSRPGPRPQPAHSGNGRGLWTEDPEERRRFAEFLGAHAMGELEAREIAGEYLGREKPLTRFSEWSPRSREKLEHVLLDWLQENRPHEDPDSHWMRDPKTRARFWATMGEHGYDEYMVHEIIPSLQKWPGSCDEAISFVLNSKPEDRGQVPLPEPEMQGEEVPF